MAGEEKVTIKCGKLDALKCSLCQGFKYRPIVIKDCLHMHSCEYLKMFPRDSLPFAPAFSLPPSLFLCPPAVAQ